MAMVLLAAALLAAPPADGGMTAGQLYDGCGRYLAQIGSAPNAEDAGAAACAIMADVQLLANATAVVTREMDGNEPDTRKFCMTEDSPGAEGDASPALVQVFILYVDAHPAARNEDAEEVFERALAEKWPCPR